MSLRTLAFCLSLLSAADVACGALELPEGWVEKRPSVLGMHMLATHEDNGSIIVLFEPVKEFEVESLEAFLGVKIANFEAQFGVGRKSELEATTIRDIEGIKRVVEVDLPDGEGGVVPARYEFHVCTYRGSYITVILGSESASFDGYRDVFNMVLRDLEL